MSAPKTKPFPKIPRTSLRTNVIALLRDALLQHRYRPGEELIDSALAHEFGVSRGPVREALLMLMEEGLVIHSHYRGFCVPSLQASDIEQITRARFPLEVLTLKLGRENVTKKDLSNLLSLKEKLLESQLAGKSHLQASHSDYAFHLQIWELASDPWLLAGLRRICTARFIYVSSRELGFAPPTLEESDLMHQQYIDFLAGSRRLTAEDCVTFHLQLRRA